ncbi:fucose-binding lectin II [Kitasatospora sp. NPDC057940]|uniref:fucose-binding lectin II n=1 Tax=Kitasatospora sp. NPDC057940 TaxID=3346285 RepID=UPI0036DF467E
MTDAYTFIKGNQAEIALPAGAQVAVKVKTNSKLLQSVKLTSKDGQVDQLFTGTGERNNIIGQTTLTGVSQLVATFEYGESEGALKPSRLNSGGPYDIGAYNLMVIVAENGDDADYNDTILEFSWYTPKQ